MYDPLGINNNTYDPLGINTTPQKEFKAEHPNLYAGLKVASDMIPYAKYIDPDERERFYKLSHNKQVRELLMENLYTVIGMGLPIIGKNVASVVSPLAKKYLPKTFEALTKERTFIKPKVDSIQPVTYDPLEINTPQPETLEAMVKGGKVGEVPKYAGETNINLEKLETTDDVKQFVDGLAQSVGIKKTKVSWDETVKAARELGWDEKEFLKQAQKKGGFNSSEIYAMRQIHTNVLNDLYKTIKELPADATERTDAMRINVLDKINNTVQIMKSYTQKAGEAGRSLNIFKKMVSENPEFMADKNKELVFKKIFDMNGGKDMSDQILNDLQKIDFQDVSAVRNILQKYHNATLTDKFFEAWLNGILSAPASHVANILGNSLALATKIPETIASNVVRGKFPLGEIKSEIVGIVQGFKDGIRAGIKALLTGVPSDMVSKLEHARFTAIKGLKGEIIRIPTKALTAADEFFKAIVYRSELNRLAFIKARKEGAENITQRMAEIINDPIGNKYIFNKAHEESLYRTFQKPLGTMGNKIMGLRDSWYPMKFIIPFIKTPTNIAKFTLERTPLNFAKIAHDFKIGKITTDELSNELAKPIIGSLISAVTAIYALDGTITGGAPKDKTERDLKYATGWQPYSIKIGDKYYSYNRLEPIGSILGMTADFVEAAKQADEKETNEMIGNIIMSVSKNLTSKTFLSGIAKVLDAISDPERYGGDYIEQFFGSLIPSGVASVARSVDPYVREVNNPLEAMQARIPFASKSLPYKEGAFGVPIENTPGGFMNMVSPIRVSQDNPYKDLAEVQLEIRKIEQALRKEQNKLNKELSRERRTQ